MWLNDSRSSQRKTWKKQIRESKLTKKNVEEKIMGSDGEYKIKFHTTRALFQQLIIMTIKYNDEQNNSKKINKKKKSTFMC